jgi:hypothetical protein
MKITPDTCNAFNTVGSFCDCIVAADSADVAAQGFCRRAAAGSVTGVTGADLTELKKALQDMESG